MLGDLVQQQLEQTKIFEDNEGGLALTHKERVNPRTKHTNVKFHFLRDLQGQGLPDLQHCPTEDIIVDIFTKPLTAERHNRLKKKLGLTY